MRNTDNHDEKFKEERETYQNDHTEDANENTCAAWLASKRRRGSRSRDVERKHTPRNHEELCAPPEITSKKHKRHAKRINVVTSSTQNTCAVGTFELESREEARGDAQRGSKTDTPPSRGIVRTTKNHKEKIQEACQTHQNDTIEKWYATRKIKEQQRWPFRVTRRSVCCMVCCAGILPPAAPVWLRLRTCRRPAPAVYSTVYVDGIIFDANLQCECKIAT